MKPFESRDSGRRYAVHSIKIQAHLFLSTLVLELQTFLLRGAAICHLAITNKLFYRIAGHPLAQNERCLHMFLQEPNIDRNYVPGKIRNA